MRLLLDEVHRRLRSENGVWQQFGVVLGIDRHKKHACGLAEEWEGAGGVVSIESRCHVSDVHALRAVRIMLLTVKTEPEILQQLDQALLKDRSGKDRDIGLVDALNDGVVEDDLQ